MTPVLVGPNDPIVIPDGIDLNDPNLFIADTHTYRSPNYLTPAQLPVPRNTQTVKVAVKHKTEGHIAGDMSRLLSKTAQVSCHAYGPRTLSATNRVYYQVVDDENEAWQCGVREKADQLSGAFRQYLSWDNENFRSIGDEWEGLENEEFTLWQYIWGLWRQVQLCKRYPNMLPDRSHIIGHYEITRQKSDPQLFAWKSFMEVTVNTLNPTPADPPYTPQGSAYAIAQPDFKAFYRAEPKARKYFGLPIGDAFMETLSDHKSYLVQYFERARFELHLESGTPEVLLGLVGVELLAVIYQPTGH